MKLRKAIKLAAAGTVFGMSTAAMAATPVVGGFTADVGGAITITCQAGYTCSSTPITDVGFMQVTMTDNATGKKYIQTILTEGTTTDGGSTFTGNSGFADENFVEIGGAGGIISAQHLAEEASGAGITETFKSTAINNAGAFRLADQTGIFIKQSVNEVDSVTGEDMNANFQLLEKDESAKGGNVTATVNMSSAVNSGEFSGDFALQTYVVEDAGTYSATANLKRLDVNATLAGTVAQTVALRERTGAAVSENGVLTSGTGSNTSFTAGDTIVNLIIEQTTAGAGVFGLNDFANETTGGANGIDSFTDANASAFQSVVIDGVTTTADPFAAIVAP